MKAKLLVISVVASCAAVLFQVSVWLTDRTPVPNVSLQVIQTLDVPLAIATKAPAIAHLVFAEGPKAVETAEATKLFPSFPLGATQRIDLNADDGTRDRLTEREWRDQFRDWLLLVVVGDSGLSAYEIGGVLFDLPPLRYGYFKSSGQFEYGESRSCYIDDGRILALVPADFSQAARDDTIAEIIDRHRKDQVGEIASLELFEYRLFNDGLTAGITRLASLNAAPYLSSEKGYHKATVTSLEDLRRFLQQIDDLTYAEITPEGLLLGGRKVRSYEFRGINPQEVAAIWQSEQDIALKETELRSVIKAEADAYEKRWAKRTPSRLSYFEKESLKAKADHEWEQVQRKIQARARELRIVDGSGFSLDPTYDYDRLRSVISEFMVGNMQRGADKSAKGLDREAGNADLLTTIQRIRPEFLEAVEALAKGNFDPLRNIIDRLKNSSDQLDRSFAFKLIKASYEARFQVARYDGKLNGTEAGMVLFYTDLLAKIWAINYQDSAPIDRINDFVDHTRVKLSPIYAHEDEELSEARLWFGPTDRGFQVAKNYKQLFFQRISTRVYSKGHKPLDLDSASEVQTSAFLAAPIDWWDDHYEEIARYEPEYFRLNEIMKWSLLIGFLAEGNNGNLLRFLNAVEVDHSNWFPKWARNNKKLRFDLWDMIEFYNKGYKGTTTEAMEFLWGKVTGGGVSLAPKTLFRNRPEITPSLNKLNRRSNINYTSARHVAGEFETLEGVAVKLQRRGLEKASISNTPKQGLRLRAADADIVNARFERVITKTDSGLKIRADSGGRRLGELNISRTSNGFKIGWQARDIDAGQILALRASRSADPEAAFVRDPAVEQLVRLPSPESYAVKLSNSDKWMVVRRGGGDDSTVGGSWHSRVADPKIGGESFQIEWADKSVVEEQLRKSHLVAMEPSTDGRLVIADVRTRGPPKQGTTNVQLIVGEEPVAATVDNSSGAVYISTKDLSKTSSQPLLEIPRLLGPEQFREIHAVAATAQDGARILLDNSQRIAETLKTEDIRRLAVEIAAGPEKANRALNQSLSKDLNIISNLVANGDNGRAVAQLARLQQVYGPQPELRLWEGLAELSRNRPQQAAQALGKGTPGRIRNPEAFFDEIHDRLADPGIGKKGHDSLESLGCFAEWQRKGGGTTGSGGIAVPCIDEGALGFEFHLVNPLRGGRVLSAEEAQLVGESGVPIYRQNSPGLNNLDWNASQKNAVALVIEMQLGKVIELPHGDIASLNPTKIIVPADSSPPTTITHQTEFIRTSVRSTSVRSTARSIDQVGCSDEDEECLRRGGAKPGHDRLYLLVDEHWNG
jgi:hypothetical protein